MRLTENRQYIEQLHTVGNLDFLAGKSVMVTGATGMLGSCLVDVIMLWNRSESAPCRVIAVGRSEEKVRARFYNYIEDSNFVLIQQDVCQPIEGIHEQVDYIIHAASNADPVNMVKYPVDTLLANVIGTKNFMEYGMAHGMKRFLFVSSGEIYGQPNENRDDFTEEYCGPLNLYDPRSCYPEGKRAAEVLCQCYVSQYGADVVIVRPCHLFGPTMSRSDSRAVAQFLWSAAEGKDIVLKSDGQKERSHCYVVDAVAAILLVLAKGESGSAYNIADRQYQMTIRGFAESAARAGGCILRDTEPSSLENRGYSKGERQVLDAAMLRKIGWKPEQGTVKKVKDSVDVLQIIAGDM